MSAASSRLQTVAWCAVALSATALATIAGHVYLAVDTVSTFAGWSGWQRPFVDGGSHEGAFVALAGLVLLLMLPVSRSFRTARRSALALLTVGALANVALGVGYAYVSATFTPTVATMWTRPSLPLILIYELPAWAVALTTLLVVFNGRPWSRPQPPGEAGQAEGPPPLGEYLGD